MHPLAHLIAGAFALVGAACLSPGCTGAGAKGAAGSRDATTESDPTGLAEPGRGSKPRAGDPTLHPPGAESAAATRATEVAWDESLDLASLYPKRDLEQRMAFIAACDMSMRARDPGAVEDAKLLAALYSESADAASFATALREEFELVLIESVPAARAGAEQSAGAGARDPAPNASVIADDAGARAGLMTGYATPFVEARLSPDARFRFPLFGDLRRISPELAVAPRREILASTAARGAVLAWVDDPLLWALVETNGTARLEVPSERGPRELLLSRVATNGRPWKGLGSALAARGLVAADGATLADVAQAARANPAAAEEAAMENERVVFFVAVGTNAFPPALGISGARLVPGYSCAADQSVYAPGSALLVVDASRDDGRAMPPRLLFVHDAGGAIRGPQRVDAYRGQGTEPLLRAGEMREPVTVYRLTRRR